MRISHFAFVFVATTLLTQPVFADRNMDDDSRPCAAIANACVDAGFAKSAAKGKRFWIDCMKPLILGQTVEGVKSIDANTVKMCRADKIAQLKKELAELQKAFSGNSNGNE